MHDRAAQEVLRVGGTVIGLRILAAPLAIAALGRRVSHALLEGAKAI